MIVPLTSGCNDKYFPAANYHENLSVVIIFISECVRLNLCYNSEMSKYIKTEYTILDLVSMNRNLKLV
jgi:hypothetical protein